VSDLQKTKYPIGRMFALGSSSEGNAFYLELNRRDFPTPFRLLIECGFSYGEISKRLLDKGVSVGDLDAVLVTHEHLDHAKAVKDLAKRGVTIYAPESVYRRFDMMHDNDITHLAKERQAFAIGAGIKVYGFPLDHEDDDGENVYALGYIITIDNRFNILFVTDTKHIRWDLSKMKFNVIFIEANYQRNTMYFALKDAIKNNNRFLEKHYNRVIKSHFCVDNTAKTLAEFDLSRTDSIYLIHLSANTIINPYDFKRVVMDKIKHKQRTSNVIIGGKIAQIRKPKIYVIKKNGEIV
jgi:phosphoribosyl 1,2-cyclic phosphodiesterase